MSILKEGFILHTQIGSNVPQVITLTILQKTPQILDNTTNRKLSLFTLFPFLIYYFHFNFTYLLETIDINSVACIKYIK